MIKSFEAQSSTDVDKDLPCDVLIYVQHLLGTGHLRRGALVARALSDAGIAVTLVSGGMPLPKLDIGAARLVQLPPLRSRDQSFGVLVDAQGTEVDDHWKAARRDILLSYYHALQPRVVMTEQFPFGRRQMRFELMPLLETVARDRAAGSGPLLLCSLRDILTTHKDPTKTDWMLTQFSRFYDLVLVHGDPQVIPLERSFPAARQIASRTRYTGYVVDRLPARRPLAARSEVLVSAGGGAVAEPLVNAVLAAQPLCRARLRPIAPDLAEIPWRVLIGHNLPDAQFDALAAQAPTGLQIERARADFLELLAACRLSISQAGYNTVIELIGMGVPAIVVPFSAAGETEQRLRAALLAQQGLLNVIEEATLSPERLADLVCATLTKTLASADLPSGGDAIETSSDRHHTMDRMLCDKSRTSIDCDGARETVRVVRTLLNEAPREGQGCRETR